MPGQDFVTTHPIYPVERINKAFEQVGLSEVWASAYKSALRSGRIFHQEMGGPELIASANLQKLVGELKVSPEIKKRLEVMLMNS